LTLPAATDTLVGKATTDTLTNKTLTGAAMNGTLGATTPSTVAATTILASSTLGVGNATPSASGAGITFPATQSASTDANTLDDYEEGTWTPNQGAGLTVVGAFSSSGFYTKIGNTVFVVGFLIGATTVAVSAGGICTSNLPFAAGVQCTFSLVNQNFDAGSVGACNGSNVHSANAIAATGSIRFSFTYTV
jgi:hypothetical protein